MYKTIDILADEFLSYKHGIGYQYNSSEIFLRGFVKFILQKYPDAVVPDKESIQDYLDTKKQNVGALYGTIAVLREFCRYLINQGYEDIYVIPPKRSPKICPEPPYFFAETEISDFFHECDLITPHASFKGRDLVIPALFRLLYCCGLRCKEVRMLKCKDVHLKNGYIDILQSKGPISRRIFITSELSDYLAEYNCCIEKIFPVRIYFFPRTTSESYGSGFISQNFRRIWIQAYPDFEETFTRPRAYDFRYPYINKIRTFRKEPDIQRKIQEKGSDNNYFFIVRTPQYADKLPSALRHFLGADLSFSSSSVANAFASCSVVMSK